LVSLESAQGTIAQEQGAARSEAVPETIGRPVRAVSVGFKLGLPLEQIADLVDKEGARGADIIALPEECRGETVSEGLDGPTITAMGALASKHRTYIVCPINRKDGDRRFNSAVLLDRRGQVAAVYNKMYPFSFAKDSPTNIQVDGFGHVLLQPGETPTVVSTDFGRVGLAICFDVNWPRVWQRLEDFGAELVIWPSAYTAGRSLQAHAIQHNYYIMSATWVPDCLVYDLDGEELLYEHSNVAANINVSRFTFDLDRCLFHQDYNLSRKLASLLNEHGDDVEREKWLPREGWFVLKAKRPGVSARELAAKAGLEERRPYINRCRCDVDKVRGWEFA
jgi:predicted amidohydrolase